MDFLFLDPDIERFPPGAIRITGLRIEPYPEGRRIRVSLELTPFQKRPNIELVILDQDGNPCGSSSLIEPVSWKLELTMHLRCQLNGSLPGGTGEFSLSATISYPDIGDVDVRTSKFNLPLQGKNDT